MAKKEQIFDVVFKEKDKKIYSIVPKTKKAKEIFKKHIKGEDTAKGFEIFKKDKNSIVVFLISHNLTSKVE